MNKKKRFIPNLENKEIKKIKKKATGAKIKCFFAKWYGSKPYLTAIDGVAAKEITQPISNNKIVVIKIFLSILLHQL